MKHYEFLEHTADEKFRAYGQTMEEAFANAALATYSIMTEVSKVKPKIAKIIHVKATKFETLLYEFIEEFIFLVDTEAFLLSEISSIEIKEEGKFYVLSAYVKGDTADAYEVTTHIKSPTYSEMEIGEKEGVHFVQVVLDI